MQKIKFILLFSGCVLLGMSAGAALSLLVARLMGNITEINDLSLFIQQVAQRANGWYIGITVQAVSHLFSYLIPALAYWYYFEQARWRDFQKQPLEAVSAPWLGILAVVTLIPFTERLLDWNQRLELPQIMRGVEQWMRTREQINGAWTNQLTAFTSVDQLLTALLVIGGVASMGEEVFFRGILQNKLINWAKNEHVGVWLAALFFSAAHMQFYGFLPRLLLGVLFGYLYVWSGNLWVAILAHLLNNSLVVMTVYVQPQSTFLSTGINRQAEPLFWAYISLLISALLLAYFYKINRKPRQLSTSKRVVY